MSIEIVNGELHAYADQLQTCIDTLPFNPEDNDQPVTAQWLRGQAWLLPSQPYASGVRYESFGGMLRIWLDPDRVVLLIGRQVPVEAINPTVGQVLAFREAFLGIGK